MSTVSSSQNYINGSIPYLVISRLDKPTGEGEGEQPLQASQSVWIIFKDIHWIDIEIFRVGYCRYFATFSGLSTYIINKLLYVVEVPMINHRAMPLYKIGVIQQYSVPFSYQHHHVVYVLTFRIAFKSVSHSLSRIRCSMSPSTDIPYSVIKGHRCNCDQFEIDS